jgi:hypothetical protein
MVPETVPIGTSESPYDENRSKMEGVAPKPSLFIVNSVLKDPNTR